MNILLYLVAGLLIMAGLSVFTKTRNPTTRKMGRTENVVISLVFIVGAGAALVSGHWLPIGLAITLAWAIYGRNEYKRRHKRPALPSDEYTNPEAVRRFLEWWLSHDPQVSEVRRPSTQALWGEGHGLPGVESRAFKQAEHYFRNAFEHRLVRLQNASEHGWATELEETGRQALEFVRTSAEIGKKYGVDFGKLDYRRLPEQIGDGVALGHFKQALLAERLLSNQRRLLMWLFHERFGRWYSPQG